MQSKDTKADFFSAFIRLYERKPLEKITVGELAKAAGYHRNTFYYYFSDMPQVLVMLCDDIAEKIAENLFQESSQPGHYITDIFSNIYHQYDGWIGPLYRKNDESHFSETMYRHCLPVWQQCYQSQACGELRDIEIEFKLRGSIAVTAYYFQHDLTVTLREAQAYAAQLAGL